MSFYTERSAVTLNWIRKRQWMDGWMDFQNIFFFICEWRWSECDTHVHTEHEDPVVQSSKDLKVSNPHHFVNRLNFDLLIWGNNNVFFFSANN